MKKKEIEALIDVVASQKAGRAADIKLLKLIKDMIKKIEKDIKKGVMQKKVIEFFKKIEEGVVNERITFNLSTDTFVVTREMVEKMFEKRMDHLLVKRIAKGLRDLGGWDIDYLLPIAAKIVNQEKLDKNDVIGLKDILTENTFWRAVY